jgi:DNA adenine methylase
MRYPGGKNSGGAYQKIINQIPPHRIYIEPFLGSGPVARFKRAAAQSILLDIDPGAVDAFNYACRRRRTELDLTATVGDGLAFLESFRDPGDAFLYVDPPYLISSTRSGRSAYSHSFLESSHIRLLTRLKSITSAVAIAGYASRLYMTELAKWRVYIYPQMTRGGESTECLWMNYDVPVVLHDYRYLGENRTERQRIHRKQKRWADRLERMPLLEKQALLATLASVGLIDCNRSTVDRNGPGGPKPESATEASVAILPYTAGVIDGFDCEDRAAISSVLSIVQESQQEKT